MNLLGTLRGLLRRWYIVGPGILLAVGAAFATWYAVAPTYERTATQLLLPGRINVPEHGNPYLYLGGLSQAADVVVTAMSSEGRLGPLVKDYPGAQVTVVRDPLTSGPQIKITVSAGRDHDAGVILGHAESSVETTLGQLQKIDGVTAANRIGIKTVTFDTKSTLNQKKRILTTAVAGLGALVLMLVLASFVDGMAKRRRRRASSVAPEPEAEPGPPEDTRIGASDGALESGLVEEQNLDPLSENAPRVVSSAAYVDPPLAGAKTPPKPGGSARRARTAARRG